jgi:glycine cleavage system aminomethyltransferase T
VLPLDSLVRDYGDVDAEARSCRADCALFDFSFVQRARVAGRDAVRELEIFQPRALRSMRPDQVRYSVKLDLHGRVRSDLTLWRLADQVFEVMSGCRDDILELLERARPGFEVTDLSPETAIFALQGPNALARLSRLGDIGALQQLPYFGFTEARIDGLPCTVGRLGYSGEQGFEILVAQSSAARLWDRLTTEAPPAGFAAIDILRIEAGFFLFTNECRIRPSIAELGLSALLGQAGDAPALRYAGFRAQADSRPLLWQPDVNRVKRPADGEIAITSACYSPHFDSVLGLGFVNATNTGGPVRDGSGEFRSIELFSPPLYDSCKRIPRLPWKPCPR